MVELQRIKVFHARNFVRHLGICKSDLCQTLTAYVRYYSTQFKRKIRFSSQTVFLRSTNSAYTQTHRQTDTHIHDDSIRRNAMRCISPKYGN